MSSRWFAQLSALLTALLCLNGCAIMSKTDCLEGNWDHAGFTDATRGHSANRLITRNRICAKHGASTNKVAYLLGYKQGLIEYCTPHRGLTAGSNVRDYRGICPAELERPFLEQYIYGLKLAQRDTALRYHRIEGDLLDARFKRLRHSDSNKVTRHRNHIDYLANKLDEVTHHRALINRRIALWVAHLAKQ